MKENGVFVINSGHRAGQVEVPEQVKTVAVVNATDLALERLGRAVTNTAMLGAFVKGTSWVSLDEIVSKVVLIG